MTALAKLKALGFGDPKIEILDADPGDAAAVPGVRTAWVRFRPATEAARALLRGPELTATLPVTEAEILDGWEGRKAALAEDGAKACLVLLPSEATREVDRDT